MKVLCLSAKTEVRPFVLQVELLTRCKLEKPRKSTQKSTRNHRKSCLGASRAPFSVDFWRSERLGRATRADSGRLGATRAIPRATKSVEVRRSGSVGTARSRDPPQSKSGNSNRDLYMAVGHSIAMGNIYIPRGQKIHASDPQPVCRRPAGRPAFGLGRRPAGRPA